MPIEINLADVQTLWFDSPSFELDTSLIHFVFAPLQLLLAFALLMATNDELKRETHFGFFSKETVESFLFLSTSNNILSNETFLVREDGSGTRILLERFLDTVGKGRQFDKKEFSSNEAIKQGVLAGLGIAMISASTAQNELKDGIIETINLSNLPIVRQWFLINLLETNLDPDVMMFKKFLLENKSELMPAK